MNIGIDIGGTTLKAGLVDDDGRILAAVREPLRFRDPETFAETLASLARRAMEALDRAVEAIDGENPLDVVEIDLREALGALCEITGEDASEEVIDRVFQSFCVGK